MGGGFGLRLSGRWRRRVWCMVGLESRLEGRHGPAWLSRKTEGLWHAGLDSLRRDKGGAARGTYRATDAAAGPSVCFAVNTTTPV
eukprot:3580141-Prymnesium_polylepis.1